MTKSEFLIKIGKLKYTRTNWTDSSYAMEQGFDECKKSVLELAESLEEGGLTVDSFTHYRNTLELLNTRYKDLFDLQSKVFDLQQEKIMRDEIQTQNLRMGKESMIDKLFLIFINEFSDLFLQFNRNKAEVKDGYDAIDFETATDLLNEFQRKIEQQKTDLVEELKNEQSK